MPHPTLKIVKIESAQVTYGDYGASRPMGPGDWSYKTPATYMVTGPTRRVYIVTGSPSGWMQRPNWYYEHAAVTKGGFDTRAACLDAVAKLEQATLETATP